MIFFFVCLGNLHLQTGHIFANCVMLSFQNVSKRRQGETRDSLWHWLEAGMPHSQGSFFFLKHRDRNTALCPHVNSLALYDTLLIILHIAYGHLQDRLFCTHCTLHSCVYTSLFTSETLLAYFASTNPIVLNARMNRIMGRCSTWMLTCSLFLLRKYSPVFSKYFLIYLP